MLMFSEQSQSSTVQFFSKNAPMLSIDGEELSARVIDDLYSLLLNKPPDKSKQAFLFSLGISVGSLGAMWV